MSDNSSSGIAVPRQSSPIESSNVESSPIISTDNSMSQAGLEKSHHQSGGSGSNSGKRHHSKRNSSSTSQQPHLLVAPVTTSTFLDPAAASFALSHLAAVAATGFGTADQCVNPSYYPNIYSYGHEFGELWGTGTTFVDASGASGGIWSPNQITTPTGDVFLAYPSYPTATSFDHTTAAATGGYFELSSAPNGRGGSSSQLQQQQYHSHLRQPRTSSQLFSMNGFNDEELRHRVRQLTMSGSETNDKPEPSFICISQDTLLQSGAAKTINKTGAAQQDGSGNTSLQKKTDCLVPGDKTADLAIPSSQNSLQPSWASIASSRLAQTSATSSAPTTLPSALTFRSPTLVTNATKSLDLSSSSLPQVLSSENVGSALLASGLQHQRPGILPMQSLSSRPQSQALPMTSRDYTSSFEPNLAAFGTEFVIIDSRVNSACGVHSSQSVEMLERKYDCNHHDFKLVTTPARFFVIKSYSEDDVYASVRHSVWCSTARGNERLNAAFHDICSNGNFCGVARMVSSVDFNKELGIWSTDRWRGSFSVKWVYIKDIPFTEFRNIILQNNEGKPVYKSRDTQEILPPEYGIQMLQTFHSYASKTTLFDDFSYYEEKAGTSRQLQQQQHEERRGGGNIATTGTFHKGGSRR